MQITISNRAVQWYKNELNINEGESIRFFVRYGGCSTVQQGFSLGVSNEPPKNAATMTKEDGITFFIEEDDIWYFDNHDLTISYNENIGEPEFNYL